MIKFFVHGIPKPKARARTVRNKHTGNIHSFTPDTTATWEQSVLIQALANKPDHPYDEPLGMGLRFDLPRPKSLSKKRKWPSVMPDLDNLVKSVTDALQGVYYVNDSRICEMIVRKRYSQSPGVEVSIYQIDEPQEVGTTCRIQPIAIGIGREKENEATGEMLGLQGEPLHG